MTWETGEPTSLPDRRLSPMQLMARKSCVGWHGVLGTSKARCGAGEERAQPGPSRLRVVMVRRFQCFSVEHWKGDVYGNGDIDYVSSQKVCVHLGLKMRAEMSRAQPSLQEIAGLWASKGLRMPMCPLPGLSGVPHVCCLEHCSGSLLLSLVP